MQASHCPDFEKRRPYDKGNFQIRLWSWTHRAIREAVFDHRQPAGQVSLASAATSWEVAKSLACQRIAEGHYDGSFSCWNRVSIFPFVSPSWRHLLQSCNIRREFVWSSVPSGTLRLTKAIRRKQEAARMPQEGKMPTCSPRTASVLPSYFNKMASRCYHDVRKDSRFWVAEGFQNYHWLLLVYTWPTLLIFISQSVFI